MTLTLKVYLNITCSLFAGIICSTNKEQFRQKQWPLSEFQASLSLSLKLVFSNFVNQSVQVQPRIFVVKNELVDKMKKMKKLNIFPSCFCDILSILEKPAFPIKNKMQWCMSRTPQLSERTAVLHYFKTNMSFF